MSTITTDPETQSDDAIIVSSDFGEDGGGPYPIFNYQVPEDSWDSISPRMATSQIMKTFEKAPPENLQLHKTISPAESVENNVSDPSAKFHPDLVEETLKKIRTEVRQTRSTIYETIFNIYQNKITRALPTPIGTTETPMKHADLSDKRMNKAPPVVTSSQLLIDNWFYIDSNPSKLSEALKWAARAGHVDVVRLLLERKPHITRQNGYQDLMEAVVIGGKDEILRLMMDNKVDMNLASDVGMTALFFAAIYERESMVEMLLGPSSVVIVSQKDVYGSTVLHWAATRVDNGHITKMLIQSGADVNSLDDQGSSPLHDAAGAGSKASARVLLNVNSTSRQ